jgi:plastocyanin
MRRAFGALPALILAIALAVTLPTASGASPSALPSGKHRCKHKAKKHKPKSTRRHKKRCRKKAASATPTTTAPGKADKPGAPSAPPGRLLATEIEISSTQLRLQLSRATVAAGDTIVEQYNSGEDPHNLILERAGTVAFAYPTLDPGATQRQTLNLAKGTWTLYCSLLDHKSLGMQATLTVN